MPATPLASGDVTPKGFEVGFSVYPLAGGFTFNDIFIQLDLSIH